MGLLDEPGLQRLVDAGCSVCGAHTLIFRAFVDGKLPILGGEPVGSIRWVYDGEKFVDGVFEVSCTECKAPLFKASVCPRCHEPGGLERALTGENRWPVPASCPRCDGEELGYVAFVPARVVYEGKRADKARTSTELYDAGFHGAQVVCRECGPVAQRNDACPLCEAPGPLRVRPG
jgi:hypothetical protein